MNRRHSPLRVLPGLLALCSVAPGARAQTEAHTRFSLELSSPDGCPRDADFVREVVARVATAEHVEGEPADLAFHVEISNGGVSSLLVTLPEGSSRRELRDVTCEEATKTFALIATLVLDARPEERLHAIDLAGTPADATPAASAKSAEPPAPPAAKPSDATSKPAVAAAPGSSRWRVGFDGGLAVESAVAPTPPPGGLLGAGLLWERSSVWSPELRAELLVTATSTHAGDVGGVTLQLIAGRFSACPLRLPVSPTFHLAACATFDYGSLRATGAQNINGYSDPMPWLAAGLAARGELQLSRIWQLELLASARRLLHDDKFTVSPNDLLVYNVPQFSVGLAAGIGVRL